MASDVITLRPVPAAESPAQVGDSGYAGIAFLQCRRYIAVLRREIGPEPDGARLRVRRSGIDVDPYIDVVVEYDDQKPAAVDYAHRCERDAPIRWLEPEEPAMERVRTVERADGAGAGARNGAAGVMRESRNRAKEGES